ncbi:MAG: glycosyltransferase family 2 protein [Stygiobacter sp.]
MNHDYKYQVSIIIITYNSSSYIKNCLISVIKFIQHYQYEIIIIDNNSDDNIENIISEFQNVFFIKNKDNIGFARACNQAIKISQGEYIFLLNPDTIILNNVFEIFIKYMESDENKNIWCVGGQLVSEFDEPIKSELNFPTIFKVILEQSGIKGILIKVFGKLYSRKNVIKSEKGVDVIAGADLFIKKDLQKEIGFFNEKFFLNYEEAELFWRAKKLGYKSYLLPQAKICHFSSKSFSSKKSYLFHLWYGQLLFFKLTHKKFVFTIIKVIHLLGVFARLIVKLDLDYYEHFLKVKKLKYDICHNYNI